MRKNTPAIVLFKNGHEWDRARLCDYTFDAAAKTVAEWKEKILREEPSAVLTVETLL